MCLAGVVSVPVVIPTWDKTLPTVIGCLDRAMRLFGGAPTYWPTDNEKTVTTGHVAGIAIRHPLMVAAGDHYGVTITACVPADPESKGGSETTVRIAKADLVPTDTNLRDGYESWSEQVGACEAFMARVNGRPQRVTRRQPAEMLSEEQQRLHRLPEAAFTAAFGETRKATWSSTIWGHLFGSSHSGRRNGVGARRRRRNRRCPRIRRWRCGSGPTRAFYARHPQDRRRSLSATTGRSTQPPTQSGQPCRGRVPRPRRRCPTVADLSSRRWHRPSQDQDGRSGHPGQPPRGRAGRMGARAHRLLSDFADGDLVSILATHPVGAQRRASETNSMQPSTRAWEHIGRGGDNR